MNAAEWRADYAVRKDRMHYACPDCLAGLYDVGDVAVVGEGSGLAFFYSQGCCFCGMTTEKVPSGIERMNTVASHPHPMGWEKTQSAKHEEAE